MKTLAALMCATMCVPAVALAEEPTCFGPSHWAATMAFVEMKNAGLTDNSRLDFTKTRTERISSEKIGPDSYRQVQLVIFQQKDGGVLEAITVSDASSQECSMGNVQVYIVSRELGSKP
jgi:hypothetical protein